MARPTATSGRRSRRATASPASRTSRRPATRSTSGCRRPSRRTRSGSGSAATSRASASTRRTRRSPGRRGAARTGSRASSTPTRPAASTATATSSSTSRKSHTASLVAKKRAGWIRARVTDLVEGQPAYSASPSITSLGAITIGGTADAVNAELVRARMSASPTASPASGSRCKRGPVVPGDDPAVLEVSGDEGWEEWTEVADFAGSGPTTNTSCSS